MLAAFHAAFPHRLVIFAFAVTTTTRFFATMMDGVYGRPGAAFGFVL
jgi:hypothetical protein